MPADGTALKEKLGFALEAARGAGDRGKEPPAFRASFGFRRDLRLAVRAKKTGFHSMMPRERNLDCHAPRSSFILRPNREHKGANMETVIIGLARCGATTIFNALTGQSIPTGDFSGGKRQANIAGVAVPDDRIDKLSALFHPKKTTYASMLFRDQPLEYDEQAGVTSASLGEVRKADAIALVIRCFSNESVAHPLKTVDPSRDLRKILDSLVFSDYDVAEKRIARLEKEAKKDGREYAVLRQVAERLGSGRLLGRDFFGPEDSKAFAGFGFLTAKPVFVVLNLDDKQPDYSSLVKEAEDLGLSVFPIRGDMEMEIAMLAPEDQKDFLADLGIEEPAKNRFLRSVYATLGLMSFFTTGEDEVRAWSIPEGTTAMRAAGVIHSDLEKGFIRAEVVPWETLLESGGSAQAKKSGKIRLEGKDYKVKDGDVLLIRFNV
jgi:GTP-binding protein YchF